MSVSALINAIKHNPQDIEFAEVIATIQAHYHYTPVRFSNADLVSEAGSNEGSCKIFAFAQLHQLNDAETLACFGHYYREDVLLHPDANDHANIRQFIKTGNAGLHFDQQPLTLKV